MIKRILGKFFKKKSKPLTGQVYVTLGYDFHPITTKDCKHVLPRTAEMIINEKYYPNGKIGEWPCDPQTGEKLPIEPH